MVELEERYSLLLDKKNSQITNLEKAVGELKLNVSWSNTANFLYQQNATRMRQIIDSNNLILLAEIKKLSSCNEL